MCRTVVCTKCKKFTWAGCGKHLESTFKNIPYNERCWCNYDIDSIVELIKNAQSKKSFGPFPKHLPKNLK